MKCASQVPVAYGPYGLFVTLLLATPPVHATLVDLAAHGRGTEGTHAANLLKNLLEDVHADGKIMDGIGPEAAGLAEAALAALAGQNAEEASSAASIRPTARRKSAWPTLPEACTTFAQPGC